MTGPTPIRKIRMEGRRRLSNILSDAGYCHRGFMKRKAIRGAEKCALLLAILAGLINFGEVSRAQEASKVETKTTSKTKVASAAEVFTARAELVSGVAPVNKGEWGILIVDAMTGETLYEKNADSYFVPASNMKLLTTALALDTLGSEYRFRTTIESSGKLENGLLTGDLILVGRGDANLSNRKFPYDTKEEFDGPPERVLSELADQIVAKGVREISGDVVGDDSYFPRERYPDGWEIDDMVWEYGAAISAIVVNDNTVTLTLTPGLKAGEVVLASVEPATVEFEVKNDAVTIGAKEKGELRLTREPGANTVLITGTIAAGSSPRKLDLAIQEPAQNAAGILARLLTERGLKIRGKVRANHEPDPSEASRTALAEHFSLPLGDTVKLVNKISQNLHAEVLLRVAARQQGRWSTPEDLQKFPQAFYAKVGIATDDVIQTDGSGLSRHDMVTPRAFVTLLQYAQKQPWFAAYYASLPVAGVDGTLSDRMKNAGITGKIYAKTGSVTHVRALSGYAETANGRKLVFSFLSNNQGGTGHDIHEALDGLCLAMIQEFDTVQSGAKDAR
jgi:serine-type D-Ala-D-Ala carboxypeptidase/endopeptidase (penicillin-binding protein 4)